MVVARYHGQVVFCRDVAAAADLYERSLGFRRGDASDGDIAMHALVAEAGEASVEVYLHPASEPAPVGLGTFVVDDVDAAIAELTGHGWQVIGAAADQPWGVREAAVTDPDGHSLTLTGPTIGHDAS